MKHKVAHLHLLLAIFLDTLNHFLAKDAFAFGQCWSLLAFSGSYWLLLATFGQHQPMKCFEREPTAARNSQKRGLAGKAAGLELGPNRIGGGRLKKDQKTSNNKIYYNPEFDPGNQCFRPTSVPFGPISARSQAKRPDFLWAADGNQNWSMGSAVRGKKAGRGLLAGWLERH